MMESRLARRVMLSSLSARAIMVIATIWLV